MQNPLFAFIDTNIGYVSVFLPFLFDVYSTEGLILTSPIADPILNDSMFWTASKILFQKIHK